MSNESWMQFLEFQRKDSSKIWATRSTKRPCIDRRTMSMWKVMNMVYYTFYGPAIQIAVLKGKGVTALFYTDKALE